MSNPIYEWNYPFITEFQKIGTENWNWAIEIKPINYRMVGCDKLPCHIKGLVLYQSATDSLKVEVDLDSTGTGVIYGSKISHYNIKPEVELYFKFFNNTGIQDKSLSIPTYGLKTYQSVVVNYYGPRTGYTSKDNTPTIGKPNDATNQLASVKLTLVDSLYHPIPDVDIGVDIWANKYGGWLQIRENFGMTDQKGSVDVSGFSYYTSKAIYYGLKSKVYKNIEPDKILLDTIVLSKADYVSINKNNKDDYNKNLNILYIKNLNKQEVGITYSIKGHTGSVSLEVYETNGKIVSIQKDLPNQIGTHTVAIGQNKTLNSGTYILKIKGIDLELSTKIHIP